MRDFQLEEIGDHPSEAVDFGAPPLPPPDPDEESNIQSELGVTIAQPDTGALRPTLIIGLGAFGRKALLELRCRFLDRFGDLSKLPLLRFLCLDADPEAAQHRHSRSAGSRPDPQRSLSAAVAAGGQLPPPQSGTAQRMAAARKALRHAAFAANARLAALGRLAYSDNQQRLVARLRREIQEITNPDTIYQSVTQTGLALRDSTPRIYVIAAAGGGGSGMLPDLGYAIRRLLAQLRIPTARSAPSSCAAPRKTPPRRSKSRPTSTPRSPS